jgi:hypothetical protein
LAAASDLRRQKSIAARAIKNSESASSIEAGAQPSSNVPSSAADADGRHRSTPLPDDESGGEGEFSAQSAPQSSHPKTPARVARSEQFCPSPDIATLQSAVYHQSSALKVVLNSIQATENPFLEDQDAQAQDLPSLLDVHVDNQHPVFSVVQELKQRFICYGKQIEICNCCGHRSQSFA